MRSHHASCCRVARPHDALLPKPTAAMVNGFCFDGALRWRKSHSARGRAGQGGPEGQLHPDVTSELLQAFGAQSSATFNLTDAQMIARVRHAEQAGAKACG